MDQLLLQYSGAVPIDVH